MNDFDFQSDGWGDDTNDGWGDAANDVFGVTGAESVTPQAPLPQGGYHNGEQSTSNGGQVAKAPKEINLSSKKAGILLCVVLVILAFIVFAVSKIDFTKAAAPTPAPTQAPVSSTTTAPVQQETTPSMNLKTDLTQIPNNLELDYTGEVYEAKGVVTSKSRYLNGTQVLHSIDITLTFGSNTEIVSYYTTIATYNTVNIGDTLNVSYQTPQEGYITLTNVTY